MSPYPNLSETPAERSYAKCRGPLGFHFLTGLGRTSPNKVTRELARALWRQHCDVSVEAEPAQIEGWTRTSIRHLEGQVKAPFASVGWMRTFHHDFQGQARIEFDAIDTFNWANPRDIKYLNERVDLLCVPGESSRAAFVNAGVRIPVAIVPYGVDPNVFRDWGKDETLLRKVLWSPKHPPRGPVFLTGGFLQPRKGLIECLDAFRLACEGGLEASMIVLVNPSDHGQDANVVVRNAAEDLPVGVLYGGLDEWAMARLYSSVDFFVSCHKLEGFGLMPLEAMACGTPAILTEYSGPVQGYYELPAYWHAPSDTKTVKISSPECETEQAIIDVVAVSERMTQAASDGRNRLGQGLAMQVGRWHTWQRVADDFIDVVDRNIGEQRILHRTYTAMPPEVIERGNILSNHVMGDIGQVIGGGVWAEGVVERWWAQAELIDKTCPFDNAVTDLTLVDCDEPTWLDPLSGLGLAGAPFKAILLPNDLEWMAWVGAYYPRGLGLLDVILWAKAHGVPVKRTQIEAKLEGLPPWWDGADGEASANERLGAHLSELNFWWGDLIEHIQRTGWW